MRVMGKQKTMVARLLAALLVLALCCGGVSATAEYLIPGGFTVGIELETQGVLVVDVETETGAAAAGLKKGDTILKVNGEAAQNVETLRAAANKEQPVRLTVLRDGKEAEYLVTPQEYAGGWRLGLLIRDCVAGIGTVTYIDPATGGYGALGHGVNDIGAARLLAVEGGILVPSSVCSIRKGVRGTPGELRGQFQPGCCIGTVETNTERGIFGTMMEIPRTPALPVGGAEQVKEGTASILSNVSGTEVREYAIRIERVTAEADNGRNLLLTVTDPDLLAATGGIVQGMSGSPILQNGKLIGAVTHVLVNHPEQGYGILIGNMLGAA